MTLTIAALSCLALNIYRESLSEPLAGQLAVAKVTLNRAQAEGKDVCEVVFAPKQFSWTDEEDKPISKAGWKKAMFIARTAVMMEGKWLDKVMWFHTIDVHPKWADKLTVAAVYGRHIFYKET